MISASEIKWVKQAGQKKFRRQDNVFIVEGDKIVKELRASGWKTEKLYAVESWINSQSDPSGITQVSEKELERMSSLATPNKALAVVKIPERNIRQVPVNNKIILVLDNLQDPGNMGTIIRTADWFGVDTIICSENSADVYNPKVIQATMGSFMRVNVYYENLSEFLQSLPDQHPVLGASLDGENLNQLEPSRQMVLIIGNESRGISQEVLTFVNQKVKIPLWDAENRISKPESLNAAMATGIILHTLRK
jgi:RNA methyltransferase, TrmH family